MPDKSATIRPSPAVAPRHFRILDTSVSVTAPAATFDPIAAAYRRFERPSCEGDGLRIELEHEGGPFRVDSRPVPLIDGIGATFQLYQLFLRGLMDRICDFVVLHAAALAGSQGGVLLAAPAGHGKSSLTLELVRRGLRFLSDDYAPLDMQHGRVHPYPRAVGVIAEGRAPIPDEVRHSAADPATPRLFGKALVDLGQVLGEQAVQHDPVPLRHVILLTGPEGLEADSSWLEIGCRRDQAPGVEALLDATSGVEITSRGASGAVGLLRVRIRHDQRPTAALARILEDDSILFVERSWGRRPDFSSDPEQAPVKRRLAAEVLARELLNRRSRGRLLQRYDGSLPALFFDLVGGLAGADCWRVIVGRYDKTADLIERLARS